MLFLMICCGKKDFPDYDGYAPPPQYEEANGIYQAAFMPLNQQKVKAHGLFWVKGNQFYARIVMVKSPRKIRIQQFMHKGAFCPTMKDDLNQDGKLDQAEVIAASGKILIPLDRVLNTQNDGMDWFPTTDKNGAFYYSRAAILNVMMADLYKAEGPGFGFGKLYRNEELFLGDRIVVLYGAGSDPLLPIACAELTLRNDG